MSSKAVTTKRPKHLNVFLLGWQLPFPGMISIVHRVTGAGLFIMLWFVLWLFDKSLASQQDFDEIMGWLRHPLVLLIAWGLFWSFIFHFCAGIRYLFLDADVGVDLKSARLSSFAVAVISSVIATILLCLVILKLFPEVKDYWLVKEILSL